MYSRLRDFLVPHDRALYVGLTGGIGSGKSTVAQVWADLGAFVVSADALAREVVQPGTPGLATVVAEFGTGMLHPDGSLNRGELAALVFDSPTRRRRLESITHPLIADAKAAFFAALPPGAVGVYDVPLLAENQLEGDFDVVAVVEAPLEARLERLEKRGIAREDALQRIRSQASDDQRRAVAHFVIDNSGDLAQLREAAMRVATELGLSR